MAQTPSQELSNIKSELRSIIAQITNISDNLKSNQGIGIDKCTQSLDSVVRYYERLLSKLNRINFEQDVSSSENGGFRF